MVVVVIITLLRKPASQVCTPYSSAQMATKKLHLHLYCIHGEQELKELDKVKCLHYCWWFHVFTKANGVNVLDNVLFSDEAWFHLGSYVNSQNSSEHPHLPGTALAA
jgi:hypothetical protein